MKKTLSITAILLVLVAAVSLFLPYGEGIYPNRDPKSSIIIGYSVIYPIVSVLILSVIAYLLYAPKRKRDLSLSIILSLGNILLVGLTYNQMGSPHHWVAFILKCDFGFYLFQYASIGIVIISTVRIIDLKAFLTAKGEYEEIVTKEYQGLP
jgi:hypothetical protein